MRKGDFVWKNTADIPQIAAFSDAYRVLAACSLFVVPEARPRHILGSSIEANLMDICDRDGICAMFLRTILDFLKDSLNEQFSLTVEKRDQEQPLSLRFFPPTLVALPFSGSYFLSHLLIVCSSFFNIFNFAREQVTSSKKKTAHLERELKPSAWCADGVSSLS